jgi:hypothetical protein
MKDRWVKVVVAVLVGLLLLSGSNEPHYTLTSIRTSEELAKCIEQRLRAETEERWYEAILVVNREDYPNHTYRISLTFRGVSPIADILVKPSDKGSLAEYRRRGWYFTGEYSILETIERCAQ